MISSSSQHSRIATSSSCPPPYAFCPRGPLRSWISAPLGGGSSDFAGAVASKHSPQSSLFPSISSWRSTQHWRICQKSTNLDAMATKTARADFENVFPSLVEDLLGEAKKFNLPDNALQWFQRVPIQSPLDCFSVLTASPVPQCEYTGREVEQRHVSTRHWLSTSRPTLVPRRI